MIHVFIDTTTLTRDPRRQSTEFKVIRRLAGHDKVRMHLSEVSCREFITQQEAKFDKEIVAIEGAINRVQKVIQDPERLPDLRAALGAIKKLRANVGDEFDVWVEGMKATVHAAQPEHGIEVLDDYFSGAPPFSAVKSRKDIPDAYIFKAIQAAAKKLETLYVVSGDTNLASHTSKLSGVKCTHSALDGFIKAAGLEGILEQTENLRVLLTFFAPSGGDLPNYLHEMIGEQLYNKGVSGFPEDYEAFIFASDSPDEVSIRTEEAEDFGEGIVEIPIVGSHKAYVCFYMPKWVYWSLEPEITPKSPEDWNDYVFQVEGYYPVTFRGTIRLEVEPGALSGKLTKLKDIATILEYMNVDVEIEEVELADEELRNAYVS